MFFGPAKGERAKKYVDEVFDHFDVDNSGELSYEGKMSLSLCERLSDKLRFTRNLIFLTL